MPANASGPPKTSAGSASPTAVEALEAEHERIVADWLERVKRDPRVPTDSVPEPRLVDHVPALLAAIVARLRTSLATVESLERDVGRGPASFAHAQDRFESDYDVDAVVREFAHLRAVMIERLRARGAAMNVKTEQMLHAALDEAIGTTATEIARQQKELIEAVIAQSAEGIVAVDEHGAIRLFNAEAVRQHGRGCERVPPTSWPGAYGLLSVDGSPLPLDQTPLYRAMHGEPVRDAHWKVKRPDGTVRSLVGSAMPLRRGDGSPAGAVLIAHDETDRLREASRREILADLSLALTSSPGGDATVDALLALVVPRFADLAVVDLLSADGTLHRSGLVASSESVAKAWSRNARVPPLAESNPLAEAMRSRKPMVVHDIDDAWLERLAGNDATYRRLLHQLGPVSVLIAPLVVRGRSIGLLKLISTNPDRRFDQDDVEVASGLADRAALAIDNARAYDESALREAKLRDEAEWRERFVAMLSHDLRTPLTSVQLSAEGLGRIGGLPEKAVDAANRIARSNRRATRMIRDLLDFARARSGATPVEPRPTDLKRIADRVVQEVVNAFPERDVQVTAQGGCEGQWDEDRIAQVVDNLVTNALRYSPAESRVEVETGGIDDGRAFLRVRNAGEPIAQEARERIFEPYKRSARMTGTTSGLGLGLYIASQLARAHGGELSLEYSDARGTSFVMVLPREPPGST